MIIKKYLLLAVTLIFISGCATVFKGYTDKVSIINPPEELIIQTTDGIMIPCLYDSTRHVRTAQKDGLWVTIASVDKSYYIHLRSDRQHVLKLKSAAFEKTVVLYPKISAGWFILDLITVFPLFFDAYTGCFNHFDDIRIDSDSQIIK